jgi:hypothetical protein
MGFARWYPTAMTLADGRMLVSAGSTICQTCFASTPEIYDPVTNSWNSLSSANYNLPFYPFMFVLPNGRVLYAGNVEAPSVTRTLDVATQSWTTVSAAQVEGGTSVMYQPGKVMKTGSAVSGESVNTPTIASTFVLDMNQPSPAWRQTASMAFPRGYANLTVLPDGTAIVTGGGRTRNGGGVGDAVYEAEIWSPVTETWKTVDRMHNPRLYHSTALLLPDGRVLVAGGGRAFGNDQLNAELYSPPYLFKGPRPTITQVQTEVQYGSNFFVGTPDGSSIASVALIMPGAATHDYNQTQRFMNLTFSQTTGGLTVQAPASGAFAPPGYHMLFIVNSNGVPSVARFVRLSTQVIGGSQAPSLTLPKDKDPIKNDILAGVRDSIKPVTVRAGFDANNLKFAVRSLSISNSILESKADSAAVSHRPSSEGDVLSQALTESTGDTTVKDGAPSRALDLVAAYAFEEGSGTVTEDATGNRQNGTLVGTKWTKLGKYGNALDFNGAFSFVTVADSNLLDLHQGMTFSAWIRPRGVNEGEWHTVIVKERSAGDVLNVYSSTRIDAPAVAVRSSEVPENPVNLHGTRPLRLNTWSYLTVTHDGTTLRMYVNGIEVGSREVKGNLLTSMGSMRIGGNGVGSRFFKGLIDEVRIYRRALSQSEIQADMNLPIKPQSSHNQAIMPAVVFPID